MKVLYYDHDAEMMLTQELYWTELTLQREFIACKEAGIFMSGASSSPFLTYSLPFESVVDSIRDDLMSMTDHERTISEVVWVIHKDGYSLIAPLRLEFDDAIRQARTMVAERFHSV